MLLQNFDLVLGKTPNEAEMENPLGGLGKSEFSQAGRGLGPDRPSGPPPQGRRNRSE